MFPAMAAGERNNLPKPSPHGEHSMDKVACSQQLNMLVWWQEHKEVPSQDDPKEFVWKVWASFEVPQMQCYKLKMSNDYFALPAHSSLDRD